MTALPDARCGHADAGLRRLRPPAREHGGRVGLVAPSGVVADVLHTTRLAAAFEIFPSTYEALAWLATGTRRPAPPPHPPRGWA
jgi:hypothetical protein